MEGEEFQQACIELEAAHNYDALQIWERFKYWDLERKKEDDQKIMDCVSQARNYMNKLLKEHKEMIERNKLLATQHLTV